eukprot:1056757-Alexandrium_andersonii.AAC.1
MSDREKDLNTSSDDVETESLYFAIFSFNDITSSSLPTLFLSAVAFVVLSLPTLPLECLPP